MRPTATGRDGSDDVGHDTSGPNTDDAMTRSEEELRVGTEPNARPAARACASTSSPRRCSTHRPVSQREEVRVEREPITDANRGDAMAGGDITEEEHEVTLHSEEPVVEKRTVPKERVRLETDTVTDERQVTDEVRKERIETDGDVRQDR